VAHFYQIRCSLSIFLYMYVLPGLQVIYTDVIRLQLFCLQKTKRILRADGNHQDLATHCKFCQGMMTLQAIQATHQYSVVSLADFYFLVLERTKCRP